MFIKVLLWKIVPNSSLPKNSNYIQSDFFGIFKSLPQKGKKLKICGQNFAILAIVHSKSGSFITCVFGIVLRSADSTHTLLHYEAKASLLHARVGIFFSDKILVNSRRGKTTGQCGVRHGGDNILLRQKSFFSTQKSRNILDLS